MKAITSQFILPVEPRGTHIKSIYPWDNDYLTIFYKQVYNQALNTGYVGSFEEFRENIGNFISQTSKIEPYEGQYEIIPLPRVEQILRTHFKLLNEDVVIAPIPYYETSNDAGGYTVFIG